MLCGSPMPRGERIREQVTMAQTLRRLLAVAAVLLFATCHNEGPPATVASVTVTPRTLTEGVGATAQLTATPKDANGTALTGRVVTWASDNTAVATVGSKGLVGGVAVGLVCGSTAVAGAPNTVASVTVTRGTATVGDGETGQLTATPKEANGNVLNGRVVTWASDNTAVATVSSTGLVTGVTQGQATITATSEAKNGTAAVAVVSLMLAEFSAGGVHTCGVTTSDGAFCWGSNSSGQLGGSAASECEISYYYGSGVPCSTTAVPVAGGFAFAAVSAGRSHTCGLTTGGAAYCWGDNVQGQLGDGSTISSGTPVPVAGGLMFGAVSAGDGFTCGLTASGAAVVPTPRRARAVPVAGGLAFAAVSAGRVHTCGLATSGAAYCWGANDSGELGDGSTVDSRTPLAVAGGLTFQVVSAGGGYTCGVTTAGAAYCWGANFSGQLGTGMFSGPSLVPAPVSSGLVFGAVSAGGAHTCGRTTGGTVYCWGGNSDGELGNGPTSSSAVPVRAFGQPQRH